MKCAIMQPTYLPWAGYFNLIRQADTFVFLDDVQFERRSWQSRNRILLNGREHFLTIPVIKSPRDTPLHEIRICHDGNWMEKHLRTLNEAYKKAAHGKEILDIIEHVFSAKTYLRLTELTERITLSIAGALKIDTEFVQASKLKCGGTRTDHLIEISRNLNCETYLSPPGSRDYLGNDGFTRKTSVKLDFQEFRPAPYQQYRSDTFVSHLSIVDVIANQGLAYTSRYIAEST